jgi:hypothetical protein
MSMPRKIAIWLLRAVLRYSSAESQEWARAMLRELDFIESDWAALFWALGSTTAVFRHSGRELLALFGNKLETKEGNVNDNQKRVLGTMTGVGIGFLLAVGGFALLLVALHLISDPARMPFPAQLAIVGIPEIIFAIIAIKLWRKRRPIAIGVLASAILLAAHVVTHVATHGIPR